jgi:hypothetical protein
MTKKQKTGERNPDFQVILRGEISASLIIGSLDFKRNRFMVYYILSDGILFLKDSRTDLGNRNAEVKKGDIICLWTNKETGFEELCGYLDENGNPISDQHSELEFPYRIRAAVRHWCTMNVRFKPHEDETSGCRQ